MKKPSRSWTPDIRLGGKAFSRADVERAASEVIKKLCCPECGLEFTDFAVEWGNAWLEGRFDILREMDQEDGRDGPIKLKCELCGHRSWFYCFGRSVKSAELQEPKPG